MNKIYKVIWNATLGTWVAVSELAKGQTKSSKIKAIVGTATVSLMVTFSQGAGATWTTSGSGSGNSSSGTAGAGAIAIGANNYNYTEGLFLKTQQGAASASAVSSTNQGIVDRRSTDPNANYAYAVNGGTVVASSTAIGLASSVGTGGGVALGAFNVVDSGNSGVAIGLGNYASGAAYSVALGVGNTGNGLSAVAIGTANQATGNTSIAMGRQAYATADFAIAMGNIATASGVQAVSMGAKSTAVGTNSVAIGGSSYASSYNGGIAIGGSGGVGGTAVLNPTLLTEQSIGSRRITLTSGSATSLVGRSSNGLEFTFTTTAAGVVTAASLGGKNITDMAQAQALYEGLKNGAASAANQDAIAIGSSSLALTSQSTAIGGEATATGFQSTAIGGNVKATGDSSIAIGGDDIDPIRNDTAMAAQYLALTGSGVPSGYISTEAKGGGAVALGTQALATGNFSTAIGMTSSASGNGGVGIGAKSNASGGGSLAMGLNTQATGGNATAIGLNSKATAENATALGSGGSNAATATEASANGAVAIGGNDTAGAKATSAGAIAIGGQSVASGQDNVSIGTGANTGAIASGTSDGSPLAGGGQIAIGKNAFTNTAGSIAIGNDAKTGSSQNFGIAIGGYATATGNSAIAMGRRSEALAQNSTAIGGRVTKATASGATAVGSASEASAIEAVALGAGLGSDTSTTKTIASGSQSLAVGANSVATESYSTAIGGATSNGVNAIAIGKGATASGSNSISIGIGNIVSGQNSGAIGDPTTISGSGTYSLGNNNGTIAASESGVFGNSNTITGALTGVRVIGNGNTVASNKAMVLGNGVNVATGLDGAVVLGDSSAVTAAVATASGTVNGKTYTYAGGAPAAGNVVSVGSATLKRQIQNVAAGQVTSTSTDAINGSQLFQTNAELAKVALDTATALGGGATANSAAGGIVAPSYTITKTDGSKYTAVNNVGAALSNLNAEVIKPITFAGNTGTSTNTLGTTLNIKGGLSAGTSSNTNVKTVVTGNTVDVQIADAPVFIGQVKANGFDASNQKVTNVLNGTVAAGSKDAVTGDQLNTTNTSVTAAKTAADNAKSTADTAVNNAATAQTAANTAQTAANTAVTKADTAQATASTAQTTANTAVTKADAAQTSANAAQTTANSAVSKADAAQTTANKGLNFAVNADPADNVQLGETVTFADGKNTTATYDAATNTYKYNLIDAPVFTGQVKANGFDANNNKITNVTDGTTMKDAVNFGQLTSTNNNLALVKNTADIAQATADKGINFGNGSSSNLFALGSTLNVKGDSNLISTTVADGVQLGLANLVTIGSGAGTNPIVINGNTGTITGLTNKNLSASDFATVGRAATEEQLKLVSQAQSATSSSAVQYDDANTKDKVTFGGVGSTTPVTLSNVKAGVAATDAVNVSQLTTTNNNVTAAQNTADAAQTVADTAQATANKGLKFRANQQAEDTLALGDTLTIADGDNTTVTYNAATNTYTTNLNKNIDLGSTGSIALGNTSITNNGLSIVGGPSITAAGINAGSKIINGVSSGVATTDAVNKGQLDAVDQRVNTILSENINTLEKGFSLSANGANEAAVIAGAKVDIGTASGETNLTVVKNGDTIDFSLSPDLTITSLTAGATKLNTDGLSFVNGVGPSISSGGIDAGGTVIKDVAAGTALNDAVNFGQLTTTNDNLAATQLAADAAKSTADTALTNAGTAQTSADTAQTAANAAQATADKGVLFGNGATNNTFALGTVFNVKGDTNLISTTVADGVQLSLANVVTIGSGAGTNPIVVDGNNGAITGLTNKNLSSSDFATVGRAATEEQLKLVSQAQSATSSSAVQYDDSNLKDKVTFGGVGSTTPVTLSNVKAGVAPTDAVNVSQLTTTNTNVAQAQATADKGLKFKANQGTEDTLALGETLTIADGENTNVTYNEATNTYQTNLNNNINLGATGSIVLGSTSINKDGLSITGGPSIIASGINAGNKVISNVANGVAPLDAVNKGQLESVDQRVTDLVNNDISNLQKGFSLNADGKNGSAVVAGATVDIGTGSGETNLKVEKTGNTIDFTLNPDLKITSLTAGGTLLDNDGLSFANNKGPSIGSAGIDAGNTVIKNVADGTGATDAVNYGQLTATNTNLAQAQADADAAQATADQGIRFGNGSTNNLFSLGSTLNVKGDSNLLSTTVADGVQLSLANLVTIGSGVGTNPIVINGNSGMITGLTNKNLSASDFATVGRAATEEQLKLVSQAQSATSTSAVQYDDSNVKNKVTFGGVGSTAPVTLSNVKDGVAPTDAVNVGQLTATNNNVTKAQTSADTAQTNAAAAQATADKGLKFRANQQGEDTLALGETLTIADGENTNVTYDANTNTYKTHLNKNIDLGATGSIALGSTSINNNGLSIIGGPSVTAVGINAGNKIITHVANGIATTDAVNKGQLEAVDQRVNDILNKNITNLQQGFSLSSDGKETAAVVAGATVDIGTGDAETNLKVEKTGNIINFTLNPELNITSLTAGGTLLDNDGLSFANGIGPSISSAGMDAGNTVIKNVADGADLYDAVNYSQLTVTNDNLVLAKQAADAAQATADKGVLFGNGVTNNKFALGTAMNVKGDSNLISTTVADGVQLSLANLVTIGSGTGTNPIALDGTKGVITGLTNKNLGAGDFATVGRAATEEQLKLVNDAQLITSNSAVQYDDPTTKDKVTLGGAGTTTPVTLSNVKAGVAPTDAVNFSQLTTTNSNVTTAQNTANAAQTVATSAQTTANKGLKFRANQQAEDTLALGDTLTIADGENTNVSYDANTNTYKTHLNKNIDLGATGSIVLGSTSINNNGLSIIGGPSVSVSGINAGNKIITHVANGIATTDAVNKGQLEAVDQRVNDILNKNITNLQQGFSLSSDGKDTAAVIAGATVDIGTGDGETNLKVEKTGNIINFTLNPDLKITSLTAGGTLLDNNGLSFANQVGPSISSAGIDAGDTVIKNVADGTGAKDAVNYGQLATTNTNIATAQTAADKAQATADQGINFGNGTTHNNFALGSILNVKGDSNLISTTVADGLQLSLANLVTIGSGAGTNPIVVNGNNGVITGLTNKNLNASDFATVGRAATEEQLKLVSNAQSATSNSAVQYDDPTTKDQVTLGGAGTTTPVALGNVKAGTAATDAVNYSQLTNTNDNVIIAQNAANTAQATADKGLKFRANSDVAETLLLGETLTIADGDNTTVTYNPMDNTYQTHLNKNIDLGATGSIVLGSTLINNNGLSITGGPSILASGLDAGGKVLGNLANGVATTDAVNRGQLDAVDQRVNDILNKNITALQQGFSLSTDGKNLAPIVAGATVDIGTANGETNIIAEKIGNTVDFSLSPNLKITSLTAGGTVLDNNGLSFTSGSGPKISSAGINANNTAIKNVENATAAKDAVNLGQVQTLIATSGQSAQISTNTLGESITTALGGNSSYNVITGEITAPEYSINGNTVTGVEQALSALDAGWKISSDSNLASPQAVKAGDTVDIGIADTETNLNVTATTVNGKTTIDFGLNQNLNLSQTGSITIGNSVLDNSGLSIAGGPSMTSSGINAAGTTISNVANAVNNGDAVNKGQMDSAIDKIATDLNQVAANAIQYDDPTNKSSVTLDGGNDGKGTLITNLKDGNVASGSKDAVTGNQLWGVQEQVTQNTTDINNIKNDINNGGLGLVKQADPTADVTVAKDTGGKQLNVAGTDGDRVVTGVAAGSVSATSKDAINGAQLHANKVETNQKIVEYLGGGAAIDNITGSFNTAPSYTVGDKTVNNVGSAVDALNQADQALGARIDNIGNQLEEAFYATNQKIDDVEKRANAGIAAAMALESAPYIPGKLTYAAGASYHGGENAIGVTLRKTADNGRWSLTGGVAAASQGDPSVRIGITGVID